MIKSLFETLFTVFLAVIFFPFVLFVYLIKKANGDDVIISMKVEKKGKQ